MRAGPDYDVVQEVVTCANVLDLLTILIETPTIIQQPIRQQQHNVPNHADSTVRDEIYCKDQMLIPVK